MPVIENRYYRVMQQMPARDLVAHMEGNEWIGHSRSLWPVYRAFTLQPGDEIHELAGGTFAITAGGEVHESVKVMDPPHIQSVMLKYGGNRRKTVAEAATGGIEEIQREEARIPGAYRKDGNSLVLKDEVGYQKTKRAVDDPGATGRVLLPEFEGEFDMPSVSPAPAEGKAPRLR